MTLRYSTSIQNKALGGSTTSIEFDPLREASELRSQLASEKRRLAFLFGAGTSQAVGLEGLPALTKGVALDLKADDKILFDRLLKLDAEGNLETILNRLRLCRELVGTDDKREIDGVTGAQALHIDREICQIVNKRIGIEPPGGMGPHFIFAHWLKSTDRTFPVEIFTTNYDLLIERALESAETPHFDGFVGTVEPFFAITSVDAAASALGYPPVPRNWVRLWKLHGSLNWRSHKDTLTGASRIVRGLSPTSGSELMIYPSHQKYADSRRLPFLAYQDRLRSLVTSGEGLLIVVGYSFSDQHINEILFQGLRSNSRLAVTVLLFDKLFSAAIKPRLLGPTLGIRNLTIYAPDGASIGGRPGKWVQPKESAPSEIGEWPFWNQKASEFTLGDFKAFAEFLQLFMGVRTPDLQQATSHAADKTSPPDSGNSK